MEDTPETTTDSATDPPAIDTTTPRELRLISPPGYGPVVPFDRRRHAGMGLCRDRDWRWCGSLNAVYLGAIEFSRAAVDFPIAFTREAHSGEYLPVAVLGLRKAENLFVDASGRWRALSYIPAYFRRHPFCIAEVPKPDGGQPQRLVCVQEDQLEPSDEPLLTADGEPTERWRSVEKLLEAVEGARQQTRALAKRLEVLDLLVPFDALATTRDGQQMRLAGMYRVDEQRLEKLPAKSLEQLAAKGHLRCIYAHLVSLENFARLLDMTAQRDGR